MIQPSFPTNEESDSDPNEKNGYVFHNRKARTMHPISKDLPKNNPAAELIRSKLDTVYREEPSVEQELAAKYNPQTRRSKHQQVMDELSTSGKPLAQIHTEWHKYYLSLPDHEKHAVWREFYDANARHYSAYDQHIQQEAASRPIVGPKPLDVPVYRPNVVERSLPSLPYTSQATVSGIRHRLRRRVNDSAATQTKVKQHVHSLIFGISMGLLVVFILLFGLFNQLVIAPFIQPSRNVSSTPIILSSDNIAPTANPEVIIPKINVEIPVVYDSTTNENAIETDLEQGVIHYASTSVPGQKGNAAFFGHSSNNILNPGKYKFAFVLLHELVPGDIFYLTYNNVIYTYQVFDKQIVPPSEVSVLNDVPGKVATATLITCDPPGTSNNRLVVWGEQISPDPNSAAPESTANTSTPAALPTDSTSLLNRLTEWL